MAALTDSWKVDVLREVRNYFAHRSWANEKKALDAVFSKYTVAQRRANLIIIENDVSIGRRILDDLADYLTDFAHGII